MFRGGMVSGSMRAVNPRRPRIALGVYPTPVESLDACGLWVKRDDQTSPVYGGNKVRKLEYLLADARARGKSHLVTVGAVGSHHVLATSLFGKAQGFSVRAVLAPQPWNPRVGDTWRADVASGATLRAARSYAGAAWQVAFELRRDTYLVPLGGSNVVGDFGYVDAARELAAQVEAGALPEPARIVVAMGSGGTAAGLAAGLEATGLGTVVVGVVVATPPWIVARLARHMTARLARGLGVSVRRAQERLSIDASFLGDGYGLETAASRRAMARAAEAGLALDPTYTSKAFAAALTYRQRPGLTLYWHTLSSAPMEPWLVGAPSAEEAKRWYERMYL